MTRPDLLPCPWCGESVYVEQCVEDDDCSAPRPHYVYRITCCTTMSAQSPDWWHGSKAPPETPKDVATRDALVVEWNTRKGLVPSIVPLRLYEALVKDFEDLSWRECCLFLDAFLNDPSDAAKEVKTMLSAERVESIDVAKDTSCSVQVAIQDSLGRYIIHIPDTNSPEQYTIHKHS